MVLRLAICFLLLTSAHTVDAQKERSALADHFGKEMKQRERTHIKGGFNKKQKGKSKERTKLPDFFGNAIGKLKERSQLPSFFNKKEGKKKERSRLSDHFGKEVQKRERGASKDHFGKEVKRKERTALGDHFGKPVSKRERGAQKDHFLKPKSNKERGLQSDHFGKEVSNRERSEEDLQIKGGRRAREPNRFVGERFRLFQRDPNAKRKRTVRKRKKKSRDHFGRKARDGAPAANRVDDCAGGRNGRCAQPDVDGDGTGE